MNKYVKTILKVLISILLIGFLIYKIGARNIYETILTANPLYIFLVVFIFFISFILPAIALFFLLYPLNHKINIFRLTWFNILVYAISRFIPGRIGDLSMVYFLKKEGIPMGKASAIFLVDKGIMFFIHVMFGVFGLFIFFSAKIALQIASIIFIMGIIGIILVMWNKSRSFIKKYILRKHAEKFTGFYKTIISYVRHHKIYLFFNCVSNIIKNLSFGLMIYLAVGAFLVKNIPNMFIMMIISSINNIISLIPITLAGLGARESISVVMLNELGINATVTLSAFVILLVIRYVSSALFLLAYMWIEKKDNIKIIQQN
jgi:uncharacterized protein (TIRG00374 family)